METPSWSESCQGIQQRLLRLEYITNWRASAFIRIYLMQCSLRSKSFWCKTQDRGMASLREKYVLDVLSIQSVDSIPAELFWLNGVLSDKMASHRSWIIIRRISSKIWMIRLRVRTLSKIDERLPVELNLTSRYKPEYIVFVVRFSALFSSFIRWWQGTGVIFTRSSVE